MRYFDDVGDVPLSLFVMTIANSATGKSHIAKLCNQSIKAIERAKMKKHNFEMAEYNRSLKDKGNIPLTEPPNPMFIFNTGTIEGIIDVIARNGYCYALVDEMATLLAGHSAKPENVGKLLGTLSTVWSSGEYSEVKRGNNDPRKTEGDLTLSLHGQPNIIKPVFGSELWRDQGTIPRFLVAEPTHKKSYRVKGQTIAEKDQQTIDDFNDTIRRIFEVLPCTEGKYTVIGNDDADAVLTDFYNEMEDRAVADFSNIASYARRATEHAGRLAGLVSVYHAFNRNLDQVGGNIHMGKVEAMAGVSMMRYYLHEYNRLSSGNFGDDDDKTALNLFDEIKSNPDKWQTERGFISQTTYTQRIGKNVKRNPKGKAKNLMRRLICCWKITT